MGKHAYDSAFRQRDHVSLHAGQITRHIVIQESWRTYVTSLSASFLTGHMTCCVEKHRIRGVCVLILLKRVKKMVSKSDCSISNVTECFL